MHCATRAPVIFPSRHNSRMSDPFTPAPRSIRAPGNVSNLRSRITAYARERGLSVSRLNQRILTEIVFGLLERSKDLGVIPMYLAEGGMALELRFGIRARASGDLDIGIVAGGDVLLETFDRALAVGFHDFTFARRGEPERLDNARTYRLKVKIACRGRPFGTLSIDLNEATHETAVTIEQTGVLTALGLPGPLNVPLLDPYPQIAHKRS
jgi:Nucleotidyl transferase AbiEii toxin, Type IV TA system